MRLLQIDAFTDAPFRGNPAAVCLLDSSTTGREPDDAWMQSVASEMNLSETAFLRRRDDGDWSLRWFTPAVEVDLCGHATLASAHALWEEGLLQSGDTARFQTRSGLLTAARDGEWIELNFPATPSEAAQSPEGLLESLDVQPLYVGRSRFDYLVEVGSEEEVRALQPDYGQLRRVRARGVIVTSRATTAGYDFVSRWFGPQSGVDEDPVTGSAHCTLAPNWSSRLDRSNMTAYQASPRGGVLRVALDGDRVRIAGRAVTVLRGDLTA
jgi:PhzF family phenazine biosynthesis protein